MVVISRISIVCGGVVGGWEDGWMERWMDRWIEGSWVLRIKY